MPSVPLGPHKKGGFPLHPTGYGVLSVNSSNADMLRLVEARWEKTLVGRPKESLLPTPFLFFLPPRASYGSVTCSQPMDHPPSERPAFLAGASGCEPPRLSDGAERLFELIAGIPFGGALQELL